MGTIKDDSGITVQRYDRNGKPKGKPLFGRHTVIAGRKRAHILGGMRPKGDEKTHPGSNDWLTVVAVADSRKRLKALLKTDAVKKHQPLQVSQSSHSSRRTLIALHVGKTRKIFKNRVIVASGPILSLEPDDIRIKVAHVKVLPAREELGKEHPLIEEFDGGVLAR
jgi:hypothetical protein